MYSALLQDWITIRVSSGSTSITQSEADWASFQQYRDIVFWLDVRSLALAGGTDVLVSYETSPAKDESLFVPMVAAVSLSNIVGVTPTITRVLLSQNPAVPLSRWVRWRLSVAGTPTSDWGAMIRIHCSANAVGVM